MAGLEAVAQCDELIDERGREFHAHDVDLAAVGITQVYEEVPHCYSQAVGHHYFALAVPLNR